MWEKHLYVFNGQDVAFMRMDYKGVLKCWFYLHSYTTFTRAWLRLADDLLMYVSGKHVEAVKDCLQTSCTRQMTWFGDLGLSLSANKSEMMVFSRKHENPHVLVRLGQTALRNVTECLTAI
jgi:hypothetical protein